MTAAQDLKRQPLAFGMTRWGPLPGTTGTLFWGGPGDGLYFERAGRQQRIAHPSASADYQTPREADRAARAFVAAYEAADETDD